MTTGLPSAIASIAKRPYQPAFSWSTTMSAAAVALERLVVVEALDELEVGVEPLDGGDHVLAALAPARRGRVDDQRAASRSLGGAGAIRARSTPGGITSASGTQRIAS